MCNWYSHNNYVAYSYYDIGKLFKDYSCLLDVTLRSYKAKLKQLTKTGNICLYHNSMYPCRSLLTTG